MTTVRYTFADIGADEIRRVAAAAGIESARRCSRAARKLAMDRGDYRADVAARIAEVYDTNMARENVTRHISLESNLLQRMADAVCVAYKIPPLRTVRKSAGASKQNANLARVARLDRAMREANRIAFLTGVSWVRPFPAERSKSLLSAESGLVPECEVIGPDKALKAWYGSDPRNPDALLCLHAADDDRIRYVLHDADACHYLDRAGQLVDRREHGMGVPPLAEIRVDEPNDVSPWDELRNDRLYTATIDLARLIAHIRWVRKAQSFKLIVLAGEAVDAMPADQRLQPEGAIATGSNPADLRLEIQDLDTSVSNAEAEIAALMHRLAESYGLTQRFVDYVADGSGVSSNHTMSPREHAALADLRDRQILTLADGDRAACARLAVAGKLCGLNAPDPDRLLADLDVSYAPLSYVDEPMKRLEVFAEEISLGLSDHAHVYQRMHPHMSLEECHQAVLAHIERRNEYNDLLSRHQISNDPADDPRHDGEQLSARQGREGGLAAAEMMGDNTSDE